MSVGSNIKRRRFEMRMTQQELADALGYKSRSTITKIENDENGVSTKRLIAFAKVLDTTVEDLVGSSTNTKTNVSAEVRETNHKNIVVILAGGKSTRNKQNIPNQFINVYGKPIIIYSMEAFQKHPSIDDIYIVCLKGWEEIVRSYSEQYGISKLKGIIPSGETGILSVKNAIAFFSEAYEKTDTVILHEATRPLIDEALISKLLLNYAANGSATTCRPTDESVHFQRNEFGIRYVDRNQLVEIQSPEAYKLQDLKTTFDKADKAGWSFNETCCCMFMYNHGYEPHLFEGNQKNIKIVRQEDITVFSALYTTID